MDMSRRAAKSFPSSMGPVEVTLAALVVLGLLLSVFIDHLPTSSVEKSAVKGKPKETVSVDDVIAPPPKVKEIAPKLATVRSLSASLAPTSLAAFSGFGGGDGGVFGADSAAGEAVAQGGELVLEKAGVDRSAKVLERKSPRFPKAAQEKNISGHVVVQIFVGAGGNAERVRVIESEPPGVFDSEAVECVKGWRFEPAISRTGPVASWVTQRIRFDLN